jgi:YVTN family beta-propeller protein
MEGAMGNKFVRIFYCSMLLFILAVPAMAAIYNPVNPVIATNTAKYLYVANTDTNPGVSPNIKIYNTTASAPSLVGTINPGTLGGGKPTSMALSPDEAKLYVAAQTSVKIFNVGTWDQATTVTGFVDIRQLAVAPDGKRLYVVDTQSNAVKVIDATNGSLLSSLPGLGYDGLWGVAISPDNNWLAVTRKKMNSSGGSVFIYSIDRDANLNISYTKKFTLQILHNMLQYVV